MLFDCIVTIQPAWRGLFESPRPLAGEGVFSSGLHSYALARAQAAQLDRTQGAGFIRPAGPGKRVMCSVAPAFSVALQRLRRQRAAGVLASASCFAGTTLAGFARRTRHRNGAEKEFSRGNIVLSQLLPACLL